MLVVNTKIKENAHGRIIYTPSYSKRAAVKGLLQPQPPLQQITYLQ